jgi:hypothetical protein
MTHQAAIPHHLLGPTESRQPIPETRPTKEKPHSLFNVRRDGKQCEAMDRRNGEQWEAVLRKSERQGFLSLSFSLFFFWFKKIQKITCRAAFKFDPSSEFFFWILPIFFSKSGDSK